MKISNINDKEKIKYIVEKLFKTNCILAKEIKEKDQEECSYIHFDVEIKYFIENLIEKKILIIITSL